MNSLEDGLGANQTQSGAPDGKIVSAPAGLERGWRADPRPARAGSGLGIGVVTYNRVAALQGCVEAIERHTKSPFHLVIADDGSTDGSSAWARECGIPVVTGRNAGCAWNKNRALFYLLRQTQCDPIVLLEDDCWPAEDGWEGAWAEAARLHGHANYLSPFVRKYLVGGSGTPQDPWRSLHVSAQCSVISRRFLEELGFLDTRLSGWGFEHIEWTRRFLRLQHELDRTPSDLDYAALSLPSSGPRSPDSYAPPYLSLSSGLSMVEAGTYQDLDALHANEARGLNLLHEPIHRPPHRTEHERQRFEHEQVRALWPLASPLGAQPARQGSAHLSPKGQVRVRPSVPPTWIPMVSVLCPTRSPHLAQRMRRSVLSSQVLEEHRAPVEFVWAWNGEGDCPLPGVVAEYRQEPFSYEEAINCAAMKSQGQVLLIINDDVVLNAPGLLARLLRLARDPHVGAIYAGDHLGDFGNNFGGHSLNASQAPQEAPEAPGIAGCCWAISHAAFAHMGGLEESLSEYGGDEMVTSVRLRRLGYEGLRLSNWRYGHALHATYGAGSWNTRHGHQIAVALGYQGFPVEPDALTYEALRLDLLDREGINACRALRG